MGVNGSRPGRFASGKESVVHLLGGWLGSRASLDDFKKRKKLLRLPGFNPGSSSP